MMPIHRTWIAAMLAALLAGCAATGAAQRMATRLAEVESVAGSPVESFHFWDLHSWQPLGPRDLLVQTRVDEGWLIRVDEPCSGLEFATRIGLSSSQQRVYARFDEVLFERQRCRIREIRPVDLKALRRLRSSASKAGES
ncbi:MAG: hypothetical protein KatS3mg126_1484 [Lysobacteraceae bacterium]|nr:MAG: hypothetical protein KatS3mg126_1484 [Xanthomonadaceae bacterium]